MLLYVRMFFCICALLCVLDVAVNAQDNQPKNDSSVNQPSYEISLQLLVSTQSNERDELPSALVPIEKKLKNDFGKNNYRLAINLLNRVSEKGSLEIKGVSPSGQNSPDDKLYNFYDLALRGIKSNDMGGMQFDSVGFSLRVPLMTNLAQDGKSPVTSYENLGITARPLSVVLNEPTIIGTMTTPRPNELVVLVLTVKPQDAKTNLSAKKN